MSQTPKTQDVNIHDPAPGMHQAQILLSLHSKLLRHKDKVIFLRMPDGILYDIFIQIVGFPTSGISKNKL